MVEDLKPRPPTEAGVDGAEEAGGSDELPGGFVLEAPGVVEGDEPHQRAVRGGQEPRERHLELSLARSRQQPRALNMRSCLLCDGR
jgi:hypothetical protein